MKLKFLFLALLLGLFAVNADAQAVLGGGGACHVSANPNTVASIAAQTNQGCKLALDVTNNIVYWYNDANAAGSKWQVLPSSVQSLSSSAGTVTLSGGGGSFTIAGAGGNTVTTVGTTTTITGTPEVITNEGLLGVTAGTGTTSVLQGYNLAGTAVGVGVTLTAGAGITLTETTSTNGGTITLTSPDPTYATYFASDAAATTGGVLINTPYALDTPNIYGLPKGILKARQ